MGRRHSYHLTARREESARVHTPSEAARAFTEGRRRLKRSAQTTPRAASRSNRSDMSNSRRLCLNLEIVSYRRANSSSPFYSVPLRLCVIPFPPSPPFPLSATGREGAYHDGPQVAPQVARRRRWRHAVFGSTVGRRAAKSQNHPREVLGASKHEPIVQPERPAGDRRDGYRCHGHW
jgi:hypothetical protein